MLNLNYPISLYEHTQINLIESLAIVFSIPVETGK